MRNMRAFITKYCRFTVGRIVDGGIINYSLSNVATVHHVNSLCIQDFNDVLVNQTML